MTETFTELRQHEAAESAANAQPLRRYWIRVIKAGVVESQYEALAVDSLAAATDAAMRAGGAKVDVMSMEEWDRTIAAQMHAHSRETLAWQAERRAEQVRGYAE